MQEPSTVAETYSADKFACRSCGHLLEPSAARCEQCGSPRVRHAYAETGAGRSERMLKWAVRYFAAIGFAVILLLAFFLGPRYVRGTYLYHALGFTAWDFASYVEPVAHESFQLSPRKWKRYEFTIPSWAVRARVNSMFDVKSGEKIDFYFVHDDKLREWMKGPRDFVDFMSHEKAQSMKSTQHLRPGTYHLLFFNGNERVVNVNAEFALKYD